MSTSTTCDSAPPAIARRGGLRVRAVAFIVHLCVSLCVAAGVLALVYLGWYPSPLDRASGVGQILLLLLAADVTLGPILTFVVFNPAKKSLRFDLAVIALMQLAALVYGMNAVEAGRPGYIVFVKDRFELVARADLRDEDRREARSNPQAKLHWFSPRIVAALPPESEKERQALMMEAVAGGRDLQHLPRLFVSYESQQEIARGKARSIASLRSLNPDRGTVIDAAVAAAGLADAQLAFLPVKGPEADVAMLLEAATGKILALVDANPWD